MPEELSSVLLESALSVKELAPDPVIEIAVVVDTASKVEDVLDIVTAALSESPATDVALSEALTEEVPVSVVEKVPESKVEIEVADSAPDSAPEASPELDCHVED